MKEEYRILFSPIRIGKCELKNRYAMAPMGPAGLVDSNGAFTKNAEEFYVGRARGGVGLIITGMSYSENSVEKHSCASMPCPTQNPIVFVRNALSITERVHAYDTKIFLQVSAGFGRVANRIMPNELPIAPSPIPYKWNPEITCREISMIEIQSIINGMAETAKIAKKSGFDGVEIHAMHEGYLIDQFALSCFNRRTDKYGGNLENRIRFAVEILAAIKEACGDDYPVVMRYSLKSFMKGLNQGAVPGESFIEYGRDIDEGLEIAKLLETAGYDALNADVGCYDAWYWSHPPMYHKKGLYLEFNEQLKKVVSIPIITAGRMDNPDLASNAIKKGQTDIIGLGRPLLADSQIVKKIKDDKIQEIRPCLSCHEACMGRLKEYMHISCAVNPSAAREKDFSLVPTLQPKRVLVIGSGVAGCEAARVLALRGHEVQIHERDTRIGGKLISGETSDFKEDNRVLINWYENELKNLQVPIYYNLEISAKDLKDLDDVDAIIVATGSTARKHFLSEEYQILDAEEIPAKLNLVGESVIIIGGEIAGCELAIFLAKKNRKVKIVNKNDSILMKGPLSYANRQMIIDLLKYYNVEIYNNSIAMRVDDKGLVIQNKENEKIISHDTIIQAIGYIPENKIYQEIKDWDIDTYLIGDAKKVKNIMYGIWDAYEIARNL